jgi:hypothetical protein
VPDSAALLSSVACPDAPLALPRSSYDFAPTRESAESLALMRRTDAQYFTSPFFGSRQMTVWRSGRRVAVGKRAYPKGLALAACIRHGLTTGAYPELPVDAFKVGVDRVRRDIQPLSNFLVG